MANSTKAAAQTKPQKPNPDFPLFPHATKRWAKKVKGKMEYFGPWDDPEAALQEWYRVKDALLQGRPRPEHRPDAYAVADICDLFLKDRKTKLDAGSIRQRTWNEYKAVCEYLFQAFGKETYADDLTPQDFGHLRGILAKGRRPKTVHNLITRIMAIINFSNKNGFTDRPILTGSYFEKPSAAELRIDQAGQGHGGQLMLESTQIRDVLKIALPVMKAMILLGVNVGMGNEDVARLEFRHLNLDSGWLDFPRPKTGVQRRAKLWPETIKAINAAIDKRKASDDPATDKYVFLTRYGKPWFRETNENQVSRAFRGLLDDTDNHVKGIGFYCLRRAFETVASETLDQPAIDLSMGHQGVDMAALYRQRLGDKRLEGVAKHVRKWLFGKRVAK